MSRSVVASGFQDFRGLDQMDGLEKGQSAWCHEILTQSLQVVSGCTDPAFTREPHRWKVIPTPLYTIFILVSKVAREFSFRVLFGF